MDKSLIVIGLFLVLAITIRGEEQKEPKKRQIYREQVLPHKGGKIPDTAFESDRLLLNQLQQDGIAVPDGILFQKRNPQVHQYNTKSYRPIFRVTLTPDGRYTYPAGRYYRYDFNEPAVDTTYSIPIPYPDPQYKEPYHSLKTQKPDISHSFFLPSPNAFAANELEVRKASIQFLGTHSSIGPDVVPHHHPQHDVPVPVYLAPQPVAPQHQVFYGVPQPQIGNNFYQHNVAPANFYGPQVYANYNMDYYRDYQRGLATHITPPLPISGNYYANDFVGDYYTKRK